MIIVKHLVILELPFEVALVPEPDPIQKLAPISSDQSLDERMRTGRTGNRLDLVDLEYPQVRSPALKAEQRIVIRGDMSRFGLPGDRSIEPPTDLDAVKIGLSDAETDYPAGVGVHHH